MIVQIHLQLRNITKPHDIRFPGRGSNRIPSEYRSDVSVLSQLPRVIVMSCLFSTVTTTSTSSLITFSLGPDTHRTVGSPGIVCVPYEVVAHSDDLFSRHQRKRSFRWFWRLSGIEQKFSFHMVWTVTTCVLRYGTAPLPLLADKYFNVCNVMHFNGSCTPSSCRIIPIFW
jgi:hypothetical protein